MANIEIAFQFQKIILQLPKAVFIGVLSCFEEVWRIQRKTFAVDSY